MREIQDDGCRIWTKKTLLTTSYFIQSFGSNAAVETVAQA